MNILNLANAITTVRLIAALLLVWRCTQGTADDPERMGLTLFVIAGVSDMLDGFIARRFNCCTRFGATLDSVADLILYAAVGLFLYIYTPADITKCTTILLIPSGRAYQESFSVCSL